MIKCQNNFLKNDIFWQMHAALYGREFPWFKEDGIFSHLLIKESNINSSQVDILKPITEEFKEPIENACAFLIPQNGDENALVHNLKGKTLIYSFDNCNSQNLISSIQKIDVKQNRALIIDYPTSVIQSRQSDKDYICMLYVFFK